VRGKHRNYWTEFGAKKTELKTHNIKLAGRTQSTEYGKKAGGGRQKTASLLFEAAR
jgi:hypothetical protein